MSSSLFVSELSGAFGISYAAMLFILAILIVWSAVWKLMALWKSARKGHTVWFILLAIINTVGILEILYIYIFSEINFDKKKVETVMQDSIITG